MRQSFAVRLSQRFMFVLTVSVLLLSLGFLVFVRSLVQGNQTEQLRNAENVVFDSLENLEVPDIPYFITYIAYDYDSGEVLETNDPFLPLLKDSKGKVVHYFEKNFFYDGDLDILYFAELHEKTSWGNGARVVCAVAVNIENDSSTMMFSKLPRALLLMALPVLILSFFVSLFITKNTINPVVKITKAAQRMTTADLDGQLPLTGLGDEIDELSRTFNDLFLRIKADFDRERQFSSDVSHELNTPITVISGQANLLLRWGKDNPVQLEKSLLAIKDEAKSMHAIIENLLQISRVESGRIKPQFCEVELGGLFERVRGEFAAVAPDVKFVFEMQSGDVTETVSETRDDSAPDNVNVSVSANASGSVTGAVINTDPEMLHQILTVLVSNSVKFAGGKCTVRLGAARNDEGLFVIYESDDGPGIGEDALPHIFERFYRGDEAHTRSAGGCGLGLAIAKTLCGALGAEIAAGNVEPHGAKFSITI